MVYNERSYILLCRVFDITKSYTPPNPPQPNTPQKVGFCWASLSDRSDFR